MDIFSIPEPIKDVMCDENPSWTPFWKNGFFQWQISTFFAPLPLVYRYKNRAFWSLESSKYYVWPAYFRPQMPFLGYEIDYILEKFTFKYI